MENELQATVAAAQHIKSLQRAHDELMGWLARYAHVPHNCGALEINDGKASAKCLGYTLDVTHKPIVKDREVEAMEYSFSAKMDEEVIPIWHMYLTGDGNVYEDSGGAKRVGEIGGGYLYQTILSRLATALLASRLFAPAK